MRTIPLIREAWHKDQHYSIHFPESWDVHVLGDRHIPDLSPEKIKESLRSPIASKPLKRLASSDGRVSIIIDDLTRPTPVRLPLKLVLAELEEAGVSSDSVTIIVGGGSHVPISTDDLQIKLGKELLTRRRVVPHDCNHDLVALDRTSRGTPLAYNRRVVESDLRIGIGCIYPHPAAGYSGGSKILSLGVAGAETISYMHDHLLGAAHRGEVSSNEFRQEVEGIADQIGLDFIVNLVINQERGIAGLFCGDKVIAHQEGVAFAKRLYSVETHDTADVVIADMYPFDTDLQFAHDRGFWPLLSARDESNKVIMAACTNGIGSHTLYPVSKGIRYRYLERLTKLHWRDLRAPVKKLEKIRRLHRQKSLEYIMVSAGISKAELATVFPNADLYRSWEGALSTLVKSRESQATQAVVYRCAPLLIPAN